MRTTTAFFAGVGTIVVAIATGVGGGVMIAGMVSPHGPKPGAEMSRVERQASQPTPVSNAASQPVNYIEATQAAAVNPVTVSPAPSQAQQPQPQTPPAAEQARAAPANASQTVGLATNSPHPDANASAQPTTNAQPSQTAAREPVSSDNASNKLSEAKSAANAKARDADSKREARREAREARRAEREARRDERRQQRYADRRHSRELIDAQSRDAERSSVRDDNDGQQLFAAEPVRAESQEPRINLFGDD